MTQPTAPAPKRPTTFAEIREQELSPEDEAMLEGKKSAAADRGFSSVEDMEAAEAAEEEQRQRSPDPLTAKADNPGGKDDVPGWAVIPEGLRWPEGRQVAFIRVPSDWTTRPGKGLLYAGDKGAYEGKLHRQAILWSLSIADEKLARVAAKGDNLAVYTEMAQRMVRAIDGVPVDWTTGKVAKNGGHVPTFWEELGPACRQLFINYYHRSHVLSLEDQQHFLAACCVVRSGVPTG